MFFLGIISWKGVSCFNGEGSFSDGGPSFLSEGGHPMGGALVLVAGIFEKNCKMGEGTPPSHWQNILVESLENILTEALVNILAKSLVRMLLKLLVELLTKSLVNVLAKSLVNMLTKSLVNINQLFIINYTKILWSTFSPVTWATCSPMTWPRWLSQCVHQTLNKDVHQWIAQNVYQWLCQLFHQWIGQHFCQLKGNNFIKKLEKWRNKIWFTSPLAKLTGEDIWLVQEFGTWSEKITVSFSSKDFIVTKSHIKVTSTFLSYL